ncbi:hypothetical protein LPJ56_001927, partial [Coemansia sp. RSA 2599]
DCARGIFRRSSVVPAVRRRDRPEQQGRAAEKQDIDAEGGEHKHRRRNPRSKQVSRNFRYRYGEYGRATKRDDEELLRHVGAAGMRALLLSDAVCPGRVCVSVHVFEGPV